MGAHPRRQPVVDWAEVQIDGLQAAEGALDMGKVLVGTDNALGRQRFALDAGADDVKTIEPGLSSDARGVAGEAEAVFGDADVKQLGELIAVFGGDKIARAVGRIVATLQRTLANRKWDFWWSWSFF